MSVRQTQEKRARRKASKRSGQSDCQCNYANNYYGDQICR